MTDPAAAVTAIFLDWLNAETGRTYHFVDAQDCQLASDGVHKLEVLTAPVFDAGADAGWMRRCEAVAKQLEALSDEPLILWVPPTADLPHGDRTEFLHRIVEAGAALEPGQRGQVEFPVTLTLKKTSSEASYVQVTGGLAPHWARLTGRAYGQYLLDTTPIHRLPEPESRVADLLEWVALLGNGMKPGASSDFKAEDAWTVTRLRDVKGCAVIGAPPEMDPTNGTLVRKLLRNALRDAGARPPPDDAGRALVLLGAFRTIDEETATIALRGCDPAMYGGLAVICLVADGRCKPLIEPRRDRW